MPWRSHSLPWRCETCSSEEGLLSHYWNSMICLSKDGLQHRPFPMLSGHHMLVVRLFDGIIFLTPLHSTPLMALSVAMRAKQEASTFHVQLVAFPHRRSMQILTSYLCFNIQMPVRSCDSLSAQLPSFSYLIIKYFLMRSITKHHFTIIYIFFISHSL